MSEFLFFNRIDQTNENPNKPNCELSCPNKWGKTTKTTIGRNFRESACDHVRSRHVSNEPIYSHLERSDIDSHYILFLNFLLRDDFFVIQTNFGFFFPAIVYTEAKTGQNRQKWAILDS